MKKTNKDGETKNTDNAGKKIAALKKDSGQYTN